MKTSRDTCTTVEPLDETRRGLCCPGGCFPGPRGASPPQTRHGRPSLAGRSLPALCRLNSGIVYQNLIRQSRTQAPHGRRFCRPAVRQAIQSAATGPFTTLAQQVPPATRAGANCDSPESKLSQPRNTRKARKAFNDKRTETPTKGNTTNETQQDQIRRDLSPRYRHPCPQPCQK